jgi:hypothetical protein
MEINSEKYDKTFYGKEGVSEETVGWGHLAYEQDWVALPNNQAMPRGSIWASVVGLASPSTHAFIYPKNLSFQKDEDFRNPERCRHHDLHFWRLIALVLHSGEGDFEGFFITIIADTISINHVLVSITMCEYFSVGM